MKKSTGSEMLVVGKITGCYGIKGWVKIHPYTEVTGVEVSDGQVRGVVTTKGRISAGTVVNATAGWATTIARTRPSAGIARAISRAAEAAPELSLRVSCACCRMGDPRGAHRHVTRWWQRQAENGNAKANE